MDLIEELGNNYKIPEKQVRILRVLEFGDLTARQISHETGIPKGRLYDYINKLLGTGLIEKSNKKPFLYSFRNKEEKIRMFLEKRFEEAIKKESLIISALQKNTRELKLLASKEDYVLSLRRVYDEEDEIFFIERITTVPFYFYPDNDEKYRKVRKVVKEKRKVILEDEHLERLYKDNFFDNLKKGKRFIGITSKKAVSSFFKSMEISLGRKEFINQLKSIVRLLRSRGVECRLSEDSFPYYLVISRNSVLLCFNMPDKPVGLVVRDRETAKSFLEYFDSIYSRAQPILPFLKGFLRMRR